MTPPPSRMMIEYKMRKPLCGLCKLPNELVVLLQKEDFDARPETTISSCCVDCYTKEFAPLLQKGEPKS